MNYQCLLFVAVLAAFQLIESSHVAHHRSHRHRRNLAASTENQSEPSEHPVRPHIYALTMHTEVRSRFASTLVSSRLANRHTKAAEAHFTVQLPEEAFISNFTLQLGNRTIVGTVKEKAEARADYDAALAGGHTAGLVAQRPRETNMFEISVNVAAMEKVTFNLTYQEILTRCHGMYKHVTNIQAQQNNFSAKTGEKTNKNLIDAPKALNVEQNLVVTDTQSHAQVVYAPTREQQESQLGTEDKEGLQAQMVVLYDVQRQEDGGEIQTVDGYFVHFFAPSGLPIAGKRVVFVIDTSGSMAGHKMDQTKASMRVILRDLGEHDKFTILDFDSQVVSLGEFRSVTEETINEAVEYVNNLNADGGTDIDQAMSTALSLCETADSNDGTLVSTIIFMTDGQPTSGETNRDRMVNNVIRKTDGNPVAIHTISFGANADYNLMKRFSIATDGIAKKVYEDSDAHLQMQGFYSQISSPLLTNVKITYLNGTVQPDSLVQDLNYNYYEGTEMVIVGRVARTLTSPDSDEVAPDAARQLVAQVDGKNAEGDKKYDARCIIPPIQPTAASPAVSAANSLAGYVERMWAYRTIKQLLEDSKYGELTVQEKKEKKDRALQLSLKYNFVTELTSMVVLTEDDEENKNGTNPKNQMELMQSAGQTRNNGPAGRSGYQASYNVHSLSMQRPGAPGSNPRRLSKGAAGRPGPIRDMYAVGGQPVMPPQPTRCNPNTEDLTRVTNSCAMICEVNCGGTIPPMGTCRKVCATLLLTQPCQCKYGFVRHPDTNECVDPLQCPNLPTCDDPNSELSKCGPPCGTLTCATYTGRHYPDDTSNVTVTRISGNVNCARGCGPPECVCKTGYVFNENGACVLKRNCPQLNCTANEAVSDCGNKCEPTCDPDVPCGTTCQPPACTCKPGYVRHNGDCILKEDCPTTTQGPVNDAAPTCGLNELWLHCGAHCELDCGINNGTRRICTRKCNPPACACTEGHARHANGTCIVKEHCMMSVAQQTQVDDELPSSIPESSSEEVPDIDGADNTVQNDSGESDTLFFF